MEPGLLLEKKIRKMMEKIIEVGFFDAKKLFSKSNRGPIEIFIM
jgi:hypothetical protein